MDASLRLGLPSILLWHVCLSQVLVTAETPQVPDILPPTEAIAQEAEVTELTASAPAAEQEVTQEVAQDAAQEAAPDAGEVAAPRAAEGEAEEAAPDAAPADAAEPAEREAETGEDASRETAPEPAEEAVAAVEEPAPVEEKEEEEEVAEVAAEVGEAAGEAPVAADITGDAVEPAPEETSVLGDPAAPEAPEEVLEEVGQEAPVGEAAEDGTEAAGENAEEAPVDGYETGASQASETEEPDLTPGPADTYVPVQSQGPDTPAMAEPEETNHVDGEIIQESNDSNEIITPKDELLNLAPAEPVPTLKNIVEEEEKVEEEEEIEEEEEEAVAEVEEEVILATLSVPLLVEETGEESELVEAPADEGTSLGLEAWKIGAISAAVFLFLETIVIIVYFLKCRKKTVSTALPVKTSEDCEAAQTAVQETEESAPAANEDQTQQNNISESLDMSQFQQEETMADIPLDPPAEASPEEPADDVCTSVL